MSLVMKASKVIRGGTWQPPRFSQPLVIDARKLEPLGKHRGRDFWFWPDFKCEVQEFGDALDMDDRAVPDGPSIRVRGTDGEVRLQPLRVTAPGTFAALTAVVPVVEKPPAPQKAIDALIRHELFTKQGTYWIRGVQPLVERLRKKGIEVHLSEDRTRLVMTGAGGRTMWSYLDAVEALTPLLVPYLRDGKPPACEVSRHPTPVEAVTIAAPGGVPFCGACEPS